MKKLVIVILLSIGHLWVSAQNNDWKGIFLNVAGHHTLQGIEAYFKVSACEGKDVVLVKFVNYNNYDVELSWFNGFFTTDKTWIKQNSPRDKKVYILKANTTSTGDCSSNKELVYNLEDVGLNASSLLRFSTDYLDIIKINK